MRPIARFRIHAHDPGGDYLSAPYTAAVLPVVGDQLYLPDGSPFGQELIVESRHLYADGRADIWLAGTDGWHPGSVAELFERIPGHRRTTLEALAIAARREPRP